jgi:hypothetical protein
MNSSEYTKYNKQLKESSELTNTLVGFCRDLAIYRNWKLVYDSIDVWFPEYNFQAIQDIICNLLKNARHCKDYCIAYEQLENKTEFEILDYTFQCKFECLIKDCLLEIKHRQTLLHEKIVKEVLIQQSEINIIKKK